MDDEILNRHSLTDLERAEYRLRTHINKRTRHPPTIRRLIGLPIAICMVIFGISILSWSIANGFLGGYPIFGGLGFLLGGWAWIYCDWFE